ncbi:E3 ubiquitin-protein ligase TRIM39 [Periophthalmus magnuspinnatus]|uniref:E3 ubiquitin-protein ligase TRIM39 n=1 Tax=Periophthalmus magnuspinnatus TaxID=409849 RepID=UPI00145A64EA|nr:E3 ubiquitin-protein ligase TRIM39 [Periophthalmus magnuspinnatus]XP_055079394.1 E3 ubiquitin-protein ligase TRIM39 [Periophthalmus magnuspinnatus]
MAEQMSEDPDLFSEQELTCSICLDLFNQPVSTPCGHNFCQACIGGYWASSPVCTCPLCKRQFDERPLLSVNRVFAAIADKYKLKRYGIGPSPRADDYFLSTEGGAMAAEGAGAMAAEGACSDEKGFDLERVKLGETVWCDVCTGLKQPAVSSCLTCTASYCSEHVTPHRTTAFYASHTLLNPQEALKGRTCEEHHRMLEVFCRSCQRCICAICVLEEHRTHKTVSVQTERLSKQKHVSRTEQEIVTRIKHRELRLNELRRNLVSVKAYADGESSEIDRLLDSVVQAVDQVRTQVVGGIQNQLDSVMSQGTELMHRLEADLNNLNQKRTEMETMATSQDHIRFLQSVDLAALPADTEDDEEPFSLQFHLSEVKSALLQVKDKIADIQMGPVQTRDQTRDLGQGRDSYGSSLLPDLASVESMLSLRGSTNSLRRSPWNIKDVKKNKPISGHKKAKVYMEDVVLNPISAYPFLILSEDRKQVKRGEKLQFYRNSPQRFDVWSCVTAKEGYAAGRHYWEVFVGENKDWKVGVVSEVAQRKGLFDMSPPNGYYALWWSGGQLRALTTPPLTKVKAPPKLRQVGVFLDHDIGQVSFFNAKTGSEIYSFNQGAEFTERMLPLLGTGDKEVPLVLMTTQNQL